MKKVLSLVLAAAMALSLAVTASAQVYYKEYDEPTSGLEYVEVGKGKIGELKAKDGVADPALTITYGSPAEYSYNVVVTGNLADPRYLPETPDWTEIDVFKINKFNFEPDIDVKGPASVSEEKISNFKYDYYQDGNKLTVTFDVTFKLSATNETSVDYKGLVLKYGYKVVDAPARSNFKAVKLVEEEDIEVGFTYEKNLNQFDEIVELFDDMRYYGDKSFEYELWKDDPVIAKEVVKFLQKNLKDDESVIFWYNENSTYFDATKTLVLDGADFDELPVAHINIKTNANAVTEIADILKEAEIDAIWYNYAVARDVVAGHALETRFADPVVYLVDADGALSLADIDEDYEDLVYGDVVWEGVMGQYLITDGEIPAEYFETEEPEEPVEEPVEDPAVDEDGNEIVENPGTGSSNAISVAVALAVVSMAAAGVVASKKASK